MKMPRPSHEADSSVPLTALIVEDEPLGYRRLRNLLESAPNVQLVGWARDAETAAAAIRSQRPNVVFLDVELAGSSGLDVIRYDDATATPLFVFVTAHAQYAVNAFDLAAVDYLLKPYTNSRVHEALRRVRNTLGSARATGQAAAGTATDSPGEGRPAGAIREPGARYVERLSVPWRGGIRVIPVAEIDWIEADGVYARLHAGDEQLLFRETLSSLEARLDPERFCRVHRSAIIALDGVATYSRAGGVYAVQLKQGAKVPVGRAYRKRFEQRLGC